VSAPRPSKPVFQDGDKTSTLTVHGEGLPREILSFNKDLYLPQTWKSAAEKLWEAAEEPQNYETED